MVWSSQRWVARARQSYLLIRCSWKGAFRWGKGEETWLLALALEQRVGDTYGHARTPARHSTTNADWFSPSVKTGLPLGLILTLAPNSRDMGQETLYVFVKWG